MRGRRPLSAIAPTGPGQPSDPGPEGVAAVNIGFPETLSNNLVSVTSAAPVHLVHPRAGYVRMPRAGSIRDSERY